MEKQPEINLPSSTFQEEEVITRSGTSFESVYFATVLDANTFYYYGLN